MLFILYIYLSFGYLAAVLIIISITKTTNINNNAKLKLKKKKFQLISSFLRQTNVHCVITTVYRESPGKSEKE